MLALQQQHSSPQMLSKDHKPTVSRFELPFAACTACIAVAPPAVSVRAQSKVQWLAVVCAAFMQHAEAVSPPLQTAAWPVNIEYIHQTGNRRSEDGEVERAPGNRQQKHMFVVSTDMFSKRLQCIYGAATRMMCSCVHASPPAPSQHHQHPAITIALPATAHRAPISPVGCVVTLMHVVACRMRATP